MPVRRHASAERGVRRLRCTEVGKLGCDADWPTGRGGFLLAGERAGD